MKNSVLNKADWTPDDTIGWMSTLYPSAQPLFCGAPQQTVAVVVPTDVVCTSRGPSGERKGSQSVGSGEGCGGGGGVGGGVGAPTVVNAIDDDPPSPRSLYETTVTSYVVPGVRPVNWVDWPYCTLIPPPRKNEEESTEFLGTATTS